MKYSCKCSCTHNWGIKAAKLENITKQKHYIVMFPLLLSIDYKKQNNIYYISDLSTKCELHLQFRVGDKKFH